MSTHLPATVPANGSASLIQRIRVLDGGVSKFRRGWDAQNRCWTGVSDPETYGANAKEWFAAGAQMVGGCCRTRPAHIREVAEAAAHIPI